MEKTYRDQYQNFIKIENAYVQEGTGVESLSIAYNPQVDTFKPINKRNSDVSFNSYQIEANVSDKRIYKGDAIYEALDEIRRNGTALQTKFLEVDTTASESTGKYKAIEYDATIVINEFLGEDATISYDMHLTSITKGTATLTGGTPTFTPSAN